jgi:hypothetical protein
MDELTLTEKTVKDTTSRSWFCVFNNPEDHGYTGEPREIVEKIIEEWIKDEPQRTCAVSYCITEAGMHHLHAVFEDDEPIRFSAVKKVYPKMHITPTKGSKAQAEDYIKKKGKWKEAGEKVVLTLQHGEIKGVQGRRRDVGIIEDYIAKGMKPNEILDRSMNYRQYEKAIRDTYYRKRWKETPVIREVTVYWHIGKTGTGKSYELINLTEKHGEDEVYLVTDYDNGFDKYNGEKVLFMDEFRGNMRFNQLLTILDKYRAQINCRYSNVYALWTEVHITSSLPPEKTYEKMVQENRNHDTMDQLLRRINYVVYHQKVNDEYVKTEIPMKDYKSYEEMEQEYGKLPQWASDAHKKMKIEEGLPY